MLHCPFILIAHKHRGAACKVWIVSNINIIKCVIFYNQQFINLKNKKISLVYGGEESPETNAAITLLRKRFFRVYKDSIKVEKTQRVSETSKNLQIIFLVNGQKMNKEFDEDYKAIMNKDQGYFIRKKSNKIYIGANRPVGFFYAATSLSQLIDYKHR